MSLLAFAIGRASSRRLRLSRRLETEGYPTELCYVGPIANPLDGVTATCSMKLYAGSNVIQKTAPQASSISTFLPPQHSYSPPVAIQVQWCRLMGAEKASGREIRCTREVGCDRRNGCEVTGERPNLECYWA